MIAWYLAGALCGGSVSRTGLEVLVFCWLLTNQTSFTCIIFKLLDAIYTGSAQFSDAVMHDAVVALRGILLEYASAVKNFNKLTSA
jgi:hypothetical protein